MLDTYSMMEMCICHDEACVPQQRGCAMMEAYELCHDGDMCSMGKAVSVSEVMAVMYLRW